MPSTIHWPGITWQSVRSRVLGVDERLVEQDRVLPEGAADDGVLVLARAPAPSRASWVSAPPATTGVPGSRPGFCGGALGSRRR